MDQPEREALAYLIAHPDGNPDHAQLDTGNCSTCVDGFFSARAVEDAGYRRGAAQMLEKVASDLEDRAWKRDQDEAADAASVCGENCVNADCHRVAAVATWQLAATVVRREMAALFGGEQR